MQHARRIPRSHGGGQCGADLQNEYVAAATVVIVGGRSLPQWLPATAQAILHRAGVLGFSYWLPLGPPPSPMATCWWSRPAKHPSSPL